MGRRVKRSGRGRMGRVKWERVGKKLDWRRKRRGERREN